MIYTLIAIFLLGSIIFLLSLCRMAKIFNDIDSQDVHFDLDESAGAFAIVAERHDQAA